MPGIDRRTFVSTVAGAGLGIGVVCSSSSSVSAGTARGGDVGWEFDAGGVVESSPTVVDGVVYVGSADYNVYALDAATGDEVWSFFTGSRVLSSPAVVDGSVYVTTRDDYSVYALDAATGIEQWSFEANDWFDSSPTVYDGTVYVGGWDRTVYALDADSGIEEWSFRTAGGITSSPTVYDGTVYVGSRGGNGRIYALDADTGEQEWALGTGMPVLSSPTVADVSTPGGDSSDGMTVFAGTNDGHVYALDADTGEEVWAFETGDDSLVASSPTVADVSTGGGNSSDSPDGGTVYVAVTREEEMWDDISLRKKFWGTNSFLAHADSTIHALDAGTGDEKWQFDVECLVASSPTVAGVSTGSGDSPDRGTVFVGDGYGRVHALDANTGESRWNFETLGSPGSVKSGYDGVLSSPTVVDGTLYVGSGTGSVYALDAGVEGSSVDSRVSLGTLGHHEAWSETATASGGRALPGPGVVGGLCGIAGAGYLLARRAGGDR